MSNTNCLVITEGFFGDIIFASSLANKLKNEYNEVDYLIGFSQMEILIKNNPDITTNKIGEILEQYPNINEEQNAAKSIADLLMSGTPAKKEEIRKKKLS